MKLKSKILLSLLATSSAAFAQTAPAPAAAPAAPETTIAYNVGVVSQYRYRGLAQTRGNPAVQGGIDYANANGFYLGAWASGIRWIGDSSSTTQSVDGKTEIDLYGGYKFEAAGVAYDFGALRYQYIGNNLSKITASNSASGYALGNANTNELYGSATIGAYTLKYSNSTSNLFGYLNSRHSYYLDLTANFDLGGGYSLSPHVGHQDVNGTSSSYYKGGLSYTDYSLTLSKDLGDGLSTTVAAVATNAKKNSNFLSNSSSYNVARDTIVVGVKYTF